MTGLLEGEKGLGLLKAVEEGWGQPWQLGGIPSAARTCAAWRTASWGLHLGRVWLEAWGTMG